MIYGRVYTIRCPFGRLTAWTPAAFVHIKNCSSPIKFVLQGDVMALGRSNSMLGGNTVLIWDWVRWSLCTNLKWNMNQINANQAVLVRSREDSRRKSVHVYNGLVGRLFINVWDYRVWYLFIFSLAGFDKDGIIEETNLKQKDELFFVVTVIDDAETICHVIETKLRRCLKFWDAWCSWTCESNCSSSCDARYIQIHHHFLMLTYDKNRPWGVFIRLQMSWCCCETNT